MSEKPHFSPSQMGMFARCGEQYRRRYINGEKLRPGVALILGSGVHKGIEPNMISKRDHGELLPIGEVQEITAKAVNERWESEEIALTEEEEAKGWKVVKGETVDTAINLVTCHAEVLAPNIQPVHVERRIEVEIQGFDHSLTGIIDLQEKRMVRDTKTRAATPPKGTSDKMLQLTIYSAMVKAVDGYFPELAVDYLVKTKTPKAITEYTARGERDYRAFLRRMEQMSEAVQKKVFSPASRENSWLCDPRWCGYFSTCPYV
jgi:RecB family exonuclease